MRRAYRIATATIAAVSGVVIVMLLLLAGSEVKGPIEDLFSLVEETIASFERKMIVNRRSDKRIDRLDWFQPYKSNVRLLRSPARLLTGAFDNNTTESYESILNLEDSLRTTFPLVHIYTAWGDKPEQRFPKLQVASILELGSVPVITWEPWLTDFDPEEHPQLPPIDKRDKGGLACVARGDYDFYLSSWATAAKKVEAPIFVRVGHEMNDPYRYPWGPHNNSSQDFISAWRHILAVFEKEGVRNILWVWSPHPAYGLFTEYYPGDEFVDYVGSGVLNYGTAASWSKWWTFKEIFGNYYQALSTFNKPIMITEFGSLSVGGDRSEWFAEALDSLPQQYPAVKALIFFHYSDDKTTTQQSLNWYLIDDNQSIQTIRERLK